MPKASCLCGSCEISFSDISIKKFTCHCHDDRKITGSMFTTSMVVPEEGLEVLKGTLKTFTKTVNSGNKMTNYFCGDCGSLFYRKSSGIPGIIVIKVGLIDGQDADQWKPEVEQFTRSRANWVAEIPGVEQVLEGWSP